MFADTIDDFVTVRYLSRCRPPSRCRQDLLRGRSSPTPAMNAAATFMLISTFAAIGLAFVVYRILTRGQR